MTDTRERIHEEAPKGRETKIEKARRLVREDRVREIRPGVYEVRGDSGKACEVDLNRDSGTCRTNAFGDVVCSHRLAAEMFASASRRAA